MDLDSPMHVKDDERDELLGLGSPAPSVELEEREVLTLLDSPMSSPPSTPAPPSAPQTPHPFGATDNQTMSAEELASRKKAREEEEERLAKKRAKSASDKALGKDDVRNRLKNPVKRPKFVEASPPPTPSPLRSKNPSALLVI